MTNQTAANKTGLAFLWLSLAAFALDLFTKYVVVQHFQYGESLYVLPIFNLTYVGNTGSAFSFLADHEGWQKYFFIGLALLISALMIYWLAKSPRAKTLQNSAYALVIGGALANAADRAYHGYVVDFFDFHWDIYHYPVFNVADIAICIGAALLALDAFKSDKSSKKSGVK